MATGRRDYTGGYLIETAAGSRYTTSICEYSEESLAAGETVFMVTYTIPAGYRFALNRIDICTFGNVRSWLFVSTPAKEYFRILFDCNYSLVISEQNPLYIPGGTVFRISCRNNDEIAQAFYCTYIGVLEQLIV